MAKKKATPIDERVTIAMLVTPDEQRLMHRLLDKEANEILAGLKVKNSKTVKEFLHSELKSIHILMLKLK